MKIAIDQVIPGMIDQNIIVPSSTEYINASLPRVKKSGEIRLCMNPKTLNTRLKDDHTEPPYLERIITMGHNSRWHTALDFRNGFWQLPVDPESQKYLGIEVEGATFEYTRIPYGLKTASAEFIKIINKVVNVEPKSPNTIITKYVDDVLIQDSNFTQHIDCIRTIIEKIYLAGMTLNPEKIILFADKIDHLGYVLG